MKMRNLLTGRLNAEGLQTERPAAAASTLHYALHTVHSALCIVYCLCTVHCVQE